MQTIPLKDLKKSLGLIGKKVAKGERFIVTRHNKPCFQIVEVGNKSLDHLDPDDPRVLFKDDPTVHVGGLVGKRSLKPGLKKGKKIPFMKYLLEDREERF